MASEPKTTIAQSETTYLAMATPQFNHDLLALIKSSQPLVYVTTHEERRFYAYMKHMSVAIKRKCFVWDVYSGLTNILNSEKTDVASDDDKDPDAVLDIIIENIKKDDDQKDSPTKGSIYILFGFHRFLAPGCDPETERRLKKISVISEKTSVIIVGPYYATTDSLDKDMALLDFPYPNDNEIKNQLYHVLEIAKPNLPNAPKRVKEFEEDLIKACRGLTLNEAQQAYCKSVVMVKQTKKVEFDIPTILGEKKQIIRKNPILDFIDLKIKISDVGGLDPLVSWLQKHKLAFQEDAASYGLSSPKGLLLLGIPGTGKSLTAKAVASLYELPLLRMDFGKMFGSLVGESEKTCRDAIKLAESLSPCILWCDEIEKGLSGSRSSGQTDGGTTSRVVSTFLTWLQEKIHPVFVMCTANDASQIPPEFMRAGRFDEVFFVDLPGQKGREQIFNIQIARKGRDPSKFDVKKLAEASEQYSGAEIEKAVEIALFEGFGDAKREITTKDILSAMKTFKPLSATRKEDFEAMRKWSDGRCVKANTIDDLKVYDGPAQSKSGLEF